MGYKIVINKLKLNNYLNFLGKPPSLLFPSGGDIRHLGLDSNVTGPYNTMAYDQGSLGALTVWWEEDLVYWTDLREGTIKRAKMPGKMRSGNCVTA